MRLWAARWSPPLPTREGAPVDLAGSSVRLLWRHREMRRRGCTDFEEVDAATGRFRLFWPAAMACGEGTVDAQVMVSRGGESISFLAFSIRVEQVLTGVDGGCEDGYSLFLDALQKFEQADEMISDAVAKADEAVTTAKQAVEKAEDAVTAAQGAADAVERAEKAAEDADAARETLLRAAESGEFDGAPGPAGKDGKDGVSPEAKVEPGPAGTGSDVKRFEGRMSGSGDGLLFAAETGLFFVGDTMLINERYLGTVTSVDATTIEHVDELIKSSLIEDPHGSRWGTTGPLDLEVGQVSIEDVNITGTKIAIGDWVLSVETGMLSRVSSVTEPSMNSAKGKVRCVANPATRAYVDEAIGQQANLELEEF